MTTFTYMPYGTPKVVEVHGYALRVIREARGRKVAELAEALKVSRSYLAHLENGSKRRVSEPFYNALLGELLIEDYRALLAVAPARGDISPAGDLEDVPA